MMGAIKRAVGQSDTVKSRLNDSVLFGMNGTAQLMTFAGRDMLLFAQASQLGAMRQTGRSSVVTGGQNAFPFDDDSADMTAKTC